MAREGCFQVKFKQRSQLRTVTVSNRNVPGGTPHAKDRRQEWAWIFMEQEAEQKLPQGRGAS